MYYVRISRREYRQQQHHHTRKQHASNTPIQAPDQPPETEPEVDEEGLSKSGYDVIICGTGLIQSILASALARAGQSVLQCDGNDYYGEMDAVLSLDHIVDWSKERRMGGSTKGRGDGGRRGRNIVETHPGEEEELKLEDNEVIVDLDPDCGCAGLAIHSTSQDYTLQPTSSVLDVDVEVFTSLGEGKIVSLPTKSSPRLTIALAKWDGVANGQTKPTAHFGYGLIPVRSNDNGEGIDTTVFDPECMTSYYKEKHNIVTKTAQLQQDVISRYGRSFALDLTPGLIYATGDAVDGLIKSGVADYLEFKSAQAIHLLMEPGGGKKQARRGGARSTGSGKVRRSSTNEEGTAGAPRPLDLELSRVPCSKGDVFQTKLLSPVEKRRLMKFLQLASDYAVAEHSAKLGGVAVAASSEHDDSAENIESTKESGGEGSEMDNIHSLNERQLLQGRSLTRPQNKVVSTSDLDTLRDYIDRDMDFDEYLRTVHSLPDRLRMIIIHAMAMESAADSSLGGQDGAEGYPTGQAMTDLCRHLLSLGRYGGTAFLFPMYGCGELSQSFCRSAAVHGATYLLRRSAKGLIATQCSDGDEIMTVSGIVLGGDVDPNGNSLPDKILKARRVVVPAEVMPVGQVDDTGSRKRILRRISVLSGRLISGDGSDDNVVDETEQRHIIVIPPGTGNLDNKCVIHGIALDESVSVAPRSLTGGGDCTVLHLTTTMNGSDKETAHHGILERAAQSLIEAAKRKSRVEELYRISFSYVHVSHPGPSKQPLVRGLIACHRGGQSITLESAFHRAKEIFHSICPGADFLALSKEMDEMVRERVGDRGDDSDDEQVALESAMDLIETTALIDTADTGAHSS